MPRSPSLEWHPLHQVGLKPRRPCQLLAAPRPLGLWPPPTPHPLGVLSESHWPPWSRLNRLLPNALLDVCERCSLLPRTCKSLLPTQLSSRMQHRLLGGWQKRAHSSRTLAPTPRSIRASAATAEVRGLSVCAWLFSLQQALSDDGRALPLALQPSLETNAADEEGGGGVSSGLKLENVGPSDHPARCSPPMLCPPADRHHSEPRCSSSGFVIP